LLFIICSFLVTKFTSGWQSPTSVQPKNSFPIRQSPITRSISVEFQGGLFRNWAELVGAWVCGKLLLLLVIRKFCGIQLQGALLPAWSLIGGYVSSGDDTIGHWGHVPPPHFYKWLGTGAPWVDHQTRNWPNNVEIVLTITKALTKTSNCTFRAKNWRGTTKKKYPDRCPHFRGAPLSTFKFVPAPLSGPRLAVCPQIRVIGSRPARHVCLPHIFDTSRRPWLHVLSICQVSLWRHPAVFNLLWRIWTNDYRLVNIMSDVCVRNLFIDIRRAILHVVVHG